MRLLTRLCCVLFVILLPLLSSPLTPTTSARNYAVTTGGDTHDTNPHDSICNDGTGACTLRAAIEQANGDPAPDVIGMFPGVGVINLNSPLPEITTNMTIMHQAGRTVVRRNSPEPFRIFSVASGVTATISNITVSDGLAPLPSHGGPSLGGGGIYNAGDLTLINVVVENNGTADSLPSVTPVAPAGGGGIHNDGVLTMTNCFVTGNVAGHAALADSELDGGPGGGVFNAGTLSMTNSTVSLNRTGLGGDGFPVGGNGGAGGGIYNARSAARQVSATLTDCIVSNNSTDKGGVIYADALGSTGGNGGAGGGIYNGSNMTIARSMISDNLTGRGASAVFAGEIHAGDGGAGGGIYNDIPAGGGELKMTNCVVANNKTGAGGVGNGDVQSLGDGGNGGGIANPSADSMLKMSQCTVVRNQTGLAGDGGGRDGVGGGIYGVPRARSNIVALNFVRFPNGLSDMAGGPFLSSGYNYMGFFGVNCCYTSTDRGGAGGAAAIFLNLDPAFIPLPGSVIIDGGIARDVDDNPVTTDRRGESRPFDFPGIAPPSGGDNSDIGALERQAADPTPTPTPTPTTVQFTASTAHVPEGCVQADITVTRSGPKDGTTVATYTVDEFADNGARQRGDFTRTLGQVTFAPGEDTKTIPVLVSEDAYAEGPETLIAFIVGVTGGQLGSPNPIILTIDDNDATDGTTNPIDDNATFVCQHYHDFLSRHADPDGQAFWTARLDECNGDAACLDRRRVDVSAAFFLSIEFQQTGYFVIRADKVAFGDQPGTPSYTTFFDHTQQVGRGVIVGQPGYATLLEANKRRFTEEIVQGASFQSLHGNQEAAPYVDSLFGNVGVMPTTEERNAAVSAFGVGDTTGRAASLRSIAESGSVYNKLYNPAFVLMQYYGYLRRNLNALPDTNFDGYNFWLNKLNAATLPGEDARDETVAIRRVRRAEMVKGFIHSSEYRGRFGGDPSRGNP